MKNFRKTCQMTFLKWLKMINLMVQTGHRVPETIQGG